MPHQTELEYVNAIQLQLTNLFQVHQHQQIYVYVLLTQQ